MNRTPRLRSSFPSTPDAGRKTPALQDSDQNETKIRTQLPTIPQPAPASVSSAPVIPVTLIDAPSQRMYACGVYGLLLVWRLYDWWKLVEDDTESFWLFIKWVAIDIVFMFGLPELRIPWLEWSSTAITIPFLVHAVLNGMLMFRIPLPIEGWLLFFTKTLFDREIAVSENVVRPASILHNASLIMGKQIINVLPDGSATLNPDGLPFCIDHEHPSVKLPIRFNQTYPIQIELLRIDFETNTNETIELKNKDMRGLRKLKDKAGSDEGIAMLDYAIKKPGLYRLHKVVDKSKLEVQRRMSDTLVVTCPKAVIKSETANRCVGDLSDLTIDVEGTPPLKIVYSRTIDRKDKVFHFQSIQPDNFVSPLLGSAPVGTLVTSGKQDVSWGRSHQVTVRLNESMATSGKWLYSIDEVHDAVGNIANFTPRKDDGEHLYPKNSHLEHAFLVHERPTARLTGCDSRSPMMVAKDKWTELPVKFGFYGPNSGDNAHTITYKFSPLDTLTTDGDHGDNMIIEEFNAKGPHGKPNIREAGLYTLTSVRSSFCEGEVKEPASCMLLNPPEPQLSVSSEPIDDKCAGNSIGLAVELDLIGTPPFDVRYDIMTKSGKQSEHVSIPSLRYRLELKPREAGHFKYQFTSIDDAVYKGHVLSGKEMTLEQDVKPPASASLKQMGTITACLEEPVEIDVELSGEKPYRLEYELVHEGKRKKQVVEGIDADLYRIKTEPLVHGGDYSLALASITDSTKCKIFLDGQVKISVRRQRPKVSFGHLEGKQKITTVEGKQISLPLRLTGEAPWTIKYRNLDDETGEVIERKVQYANDIIKVNKLGTYEILEVRDDRCPGTVDATASIFDVNWFPRPDIKLADSASLIHQGNKFIKREVCEGDVDSVEINLFGSAPYHVKYNIRHKAKHGSSINIKQFDVGLGVATITMDTTKAGTNEYSFSELSDNLYDHNSKKFSPLVIEQKVNPKPLAQFVKPGQSYKYCKEELAGDEVIPIKLEGTPPFSLEIDIKHQSSSRPETVSIPNIEANQYNFRIPHRVLSLGAHQVSVRKVRDSNGCQQKTEFGAPHVQVQVYDSPTIYPSESRTDYCVGDRISYTLSGTPPFEVYYTFADIQRKAKSPSTNFRRIAESPGNFTIAAVSDKASECKASTSITKIIHEMPSVRISKGRQVEVDIHEGGQAEIVFEFGGTPPFEFTYTRSTNARKGQKSQVLETRHEVSHDYSMTILSSEEGTYEVVAIKDKFCSFSTQKAGTRDSQKLLQF
ncbi:hypothetical protein B7463_g12035, partial [Scytalidium lignicola]